MTRGANIEAIYPLSPVQEGMLFHLQVEGESGSYLRQVIWALPRGVDTQALRRAWQTVIERHSILRTAFVWKHQEEPLQVVRRKVAVAWEEQDWRELDEDRQRERHDLLLHKQRRVGFDLTQTPLLRLILVRTGDNAFQLLWSYPQLLLDGWSRRIVQREVLACYQAFLQGREPELPAAPPYRDHIAWLRRQELSKAEAYWRRELAGFRAATPLPTRPGARLGRAAAGYEHERLSLPAEPTEKLRSLARRSRLTLNTLIQGGWAALLAHYSGECDVLFGVVVSGRPADLPGVENMVGQFVNVVPERVQICPEDTLVRWLQALQARQVETREYDYAPLVRIQGWSELPGGEPLFESVVAFQNYGGSEDRNAEDAEIDGPHQLQSFEQSSFAMDLTAIPGAELSLTLTYDPVPFARETVHRMLHHLWNLLAAFAVCPEWRILQLPLLTAAERHQVLAEWNDSYALVNDGGGLHQLFEAEAARYPEATAVLARGLRISYAELDRRANRLARRLRDLGAGPESLVAILGERSPEMLMALLSALKAGAAFLPLDASYPEERLRWILEDAAPAVLLARQATAERLRPVGMPVLPFETLERETAGRSETPLGLPVPPESLAYAIYTSGSTGRPKGVLVSHRAALSYVRAIARRLRIGRRDRFLQFASPGFDVVIEETFPAWSRGAAVVLGEPELAASPVGLLAAIRRDGLTVIELPAAYWHEWMDALAVHGEPLPSSLRLLIVGCEQASARRLFAWQASGIPIANIFGITEATITSSLYELAPHEPIDPETFRMPIGRPIGNTRLYVAGPELTPAPVGAPAELLIGGAGLSRGYLNRPALTAQRFVPDPFSAEPGARLYRTGDLARWRPDGHLEFLGRLDEQVKIRGFRVELGEIETQLLSLPGLRQAAVVVREDSPEARRLVAYVVPDESGCEIAALRERLGERLPNYMLPACFVEIPALPLTAHGKVDRRALPAPEVSAAPTAEEAVPRTPVEQLLAQLWSRVLGVERIGCQDDFFELGGHSLLAMRVISRVRETFGVELPVLSLFESPTLAGLAQQVEAALRAGSVSERPPIAPVPRGADLALSFAQQRLWFLDQLEPDSSLYNIALALRTSGPLRSQTLARALGELMRRHEVLRSTYPTVNGEGRVRIAPPAPFALPAIDLQSLKAQPVREMEVRRLAAAEARRPFDLQHDALLRVRLLRTAEAEHVILVTMHHITTDEWSMGIFVRELAELYRAFLQGHPSPLPELPIQYADYAAWQRQWLQGVVLERELAYWRQQLAGALPLLTLPTDRPRPAIQTYRGARRSWRPGPALSEALRQVSRQEGATLFMTLLAAFQALLGHSAGQEDVCVGSPVAGRNHAGTEPLIGFFVNTLVLRADLSGESTFRALLAQVRGTALGAYTHQDLPFEKLVDELRLERDLSYSPLFQVLFTWENATPGDALELPELRLTGLATADDVAKFDLVLSLMETPSGLRCSLAYNTDLFDGVTAVRLLDRFNGLLERIAVRPDLPLPELLGPSEVERHLVLTEWSSGPASTGGESLLEMFAAQVKRSPGATALIAGDVKFSYRELDLRSNQLARYLRREGVRPEVLVGVCVERSAEMVLGLLGVLKAGGAYLPMDPTYPRERLAWMLEDGRPLRLLTQRSLKPNLPEAAPSSLCLDFDWREIAAESDKPVASERLPDNLSYVIFTSGSTGRPKGVQVLDQGLDNFLRFFRDRLGLTESDIFLAVTTLSFDIAALELFLPLCVGARLVVASREEILDGYGLAQRLRVSGVTAMQATPSTWRMLLTVGWEGSPEVRVLCGGEALPQDLADLLVERSAVLWNLYGPTETTIWSVLSQVGRGKAVSIGRPIADTQLYLLDRSLRPVPVGVVGDLYLAGAGLARGYLGEPIMTAERFIPHPFAARLGDRLYRTGDLARFNADGTLQFLGRVDAQVKVRGFRIELGEIEAALRRHPAVRQATATVRDGGSGPHVVAYLVPEPSFTQRAQVSEELRGFLLRTLPDYMIPSFFVVLEALPLTPNGKVDHRALPAPDLERPAGNAAPRTPVEARLARVWADVLRLDRVGIHDNFFALGGDSILTIQIVSRARQAGIHLTPKEVFQHQTIAELARQARSAPPVLAEQGVVSGEVPLSPIGYWFLERELRNPNHFNQSLLLAARQPFEAGALARAVAALVRHHDALRLRLVREGEGWRQWIAGGEAETPFVAVDLSLMPEACQGPALEILAQQVQRSLDLSQGPVLRIALFDLGPQRPQRLLMVVHHLAVDGVSWRLLLEDLSSAYESLVAGRAVGLPPKTTSFKQWCERLSAHARGGALAAELDVWLDPRWERAAPSPVAHRGKMAPERVKVALSAAETQALLQQVPGVYRTRLDEVLLTALAQALSRWTGGRLVSVDLESHGREELFEDVDLSRTVGWCTAMYPVLLELPPERQPGESLQSVKEQLRALPARGIGYGLLRYLSGDAKEAERLRAQPCPEVIFNYQGRLDQALPQSSPFMPAPESKGENQGPAETATHLLEVDAAVLAGRLEMLWGYCEALDATAVRGLAESCLAALRELIEHCLSPAAGGYTRSDFPLARLDTERLASLLGTDRNVEDLYPLSPLQRGLLFHALYQPDSEAYFEQVNLRLEGGLNLERFRQAWGEVLTRHPILRTCFLWEGLDEPLQLVRGAVELPWEESDWRHLPEVEREARLVTVLIADRRRGFAPTRAPVMRAALIHWTDQAYQFIWSYHHLLLDGWCLGLIFREVLALYEGRGAALEPASPYRNYIEWLLRQDLVTAEAHWRETLRGFTAPTQIGLSAAVPGATEEGAGGEITIALPASSTERLAGLARRHQLTLNTVLQAAWALLLARYSGDTDVVFGTVVSGRPAEVAGIETMMGLFINTLPIRVGVDSEHRLLDWMGEIQEQHIELRQYEHSPLVQVQAWSDVPAGTPLFESLFTFENLPLRESLHPPETGVRVADVRAAERTHYPIAVLSAPGPRLPLKLQFDRRRLAVAAAERMLGHLRTLLEELGDAPERRLGELSLLSEAERHQLLREWNDSTGRQLLRPCLHELFETQAARTPDSPAVVFRDQVLCYGELARRTAALARRLRAACVGPETRVALYLERSVDAVVGLLGVLRAGGAYLPLDTKAPASRLSALLADAGAAVVITRESMREELPRSTAQVLCLDDAAVADGEIACGPSWRPLAGNLVYLLYTSGSTGAPKGVAVEHDQAVSYLWGIMERLDLPASSSYATVSSFATDLGNTAIFPALCSGGCLHVVPDETVAHPEKFAEYVSQRAIDCLKIVPSHLEALLNVERPERSLPRRRLVLGGEATSRALMERLQALHPECSILNHYGPTETTVGVLTGAIDPSLPLSGTAPLGRPLGGVQVYVLDRAVLPVPVGVPGELCIGGSSVSRGYIGAPAVTAAKFVPDPLGGQAGARLYHSGDLARQLADGRLEFLGRIDQQVKVRGFRVELGEIEEALREYPAVQYAVVNACGEPDRRLAAYLVAAAGPPPASADLRDFLEKRLPTYMVPSYFVVLPELPLLPSGKVNRRALPEPGPRPAPLSVAEPSTLIEEMLVGIWMDVLRVAHVGLHDDFFELGGHSLLAIQVVSRVRQIFRVELPVRSLFDQPTVARLARALAEMRAAEAETLAPPIVPLSREAHRVRIAPLRERGRHELALGTAAGDEAFVFPASFAQQRLWFLQQMDLGSTAYNILHALRLEGELNVLALHATLDEVVRRHETLRTTFGILKGELVQLVEPGGSLAVPLVDLSGLAESEREEELQRLARREPHQPFDLCHGPLLRVTLLRLGSEEHAALFSIHHIVSDAWSTALLVREVGQLYAAFSLSLPSPLPELEVQYADYSHWQRQQLQGPVLQAHLSYWKQRLSGRLPLLRLSQNERSSQSSRGGREAFRLPADLSMSLRGLARREGATLFMALLAGFLVMLHRRCGERDITVGTAIANRNRAETEGLIGFFINMLVLRADLSRNPTFRELLAQVREEALGAYAHQDLPFEKLVEELGSDRDRRGAPLFQVAFGLNNAPAKILDLPNLRLRPIPLADELARYELTLWMTDSADGLVSSWTYQAELFDPPAVVRLHQTFASILAEVARDPGVRIDDLEFVGQEERTWRSEQVKTREQAKRQKLQTIKPKAVKLGGAA
jgi:amino acid adenylation domain-containing protein/non-ribosomal peptide synthase protein (TIGR01720 family)